MIEIDQNDHGGRRGRQPVFFPNLIEYLICQNFDHVISKTIAFISFNNIYSNSRSFSIRCPRRSSTTVPNGKGGTEKRFPFDRPEYVHVSVVIRAFRRSRQTFSRNFFIVGPRAINTRVRAHTHVSKTDRRRSDKRHRTTLNNNIRRIRFDAGAAARSAVVCVAFVSNRDLPRANSKDD